MATAVNSLATLRTDAAVAAPLALNAVPAYSGLRRQQTPRASAPVGKAIGSRSNVRLASKQLRVTATIAPEAPVVSSRSAEIIDDESKYIVQTYARAPGLVASHGKGAYLYSVDGKEYLDFTAGIAVNCLGHSDPTWVEAVKEQAEKLCHVSNLFHTEPQVQLAKRLVDLSFADRVFFANSGTEANEAAIKFSRKYAKVRSEKAGAPAASPLDSLLKGFQPRKPDFIAFNNSFHGRTLGALALTSKIKYREPFEPIMPGVQFLPFNDLKAVEAAIIPGHTAAIFVEPVQGEGGCFPSLPTFLKGLRKLCDDTDTLLVFDEVQCGLGRCGKVFGYELFGVAPDILTLAKPLAGGLPIGAVLVTDKVASVMQPGDHGSTFAGGPLVTYVALKTVDKILSPGFLENVTATGESLRTKLRAALADNPHVLDVRGAGLLVGIQLDTQAGPVADKARELGLLILTAGAGDIIRLAPPLIIDESHVDKAVELIVEAMKVL